MKVVQMASRRIYHDLAVPVAAPAAGQDLETVTVAVQVDPEFLAGYVLRFD